jgi:hypothetical protein
MHAGYLVLFCARLTMPGMLECAGTPRPLSAVQRVLCCAVCFIQAHSRERQVSDIPAHACVPLLRPSAHRSLRCGVVMAARCSSPGSVARHRRSHAGHRINITISPDVSVHCILSFSTAVYRCHQPDRKKNLTCTLKSHAQALQLIVCMIISGLRCMALNHSALC